MLHIQATSVQHESQVPEIGLKKSVVTGHQSPPAATNPYIATYHTFTVIYFIIPYNNIF